MKDTQGKADQREVDLQRVGIKNVDLPFRIQEQAGGIQTVLARVQLGVDLPRHFKGTHMSRFVEILERWKDQPSSSGQLEHILADTRRRLEADRAHIKASFKYFVSKEAPVSRQVSTMGYDCQYEATLTGPSGYDLVVGVQVPITTVCPCSKEISVAGAHNQRAWLRVKLRTLPGQFMWFEDLIRQLETFGSCEIYPLVKRPDEKYVTEKGYFNPKFVEDVLRDVVVWLRSHPAVTWFEVECEADESIHLHNAFAYQQEPVPAALNVFVRELSDEVLDEVPGVLGYAGDGPGAGGGAGVTTATGATNGAAKGKNANGAANGAAKGKNANGAANGAAKGKNANGAASKAGTKHPGEVAVDLPDVASRSPRG